MYMYMMRDLRNMAHVHKHVRVPVNKHNTSGIGGRPTSNGTEIVISWYPSWTTLRGYACCKMSTSAIVLKWSLQVHPARV